MLGEIEYSPPLDKSDHLVLIFTLTLYTEQEIRSGEKLKYFKADFYSMNKNLRKIDWDSFICQSSSINKAWKNFTDIIYNQFEENLPVCKVLNPKRNNPWMNETASKAVRNNKNKTKTLEQIDS